MRTPLLFLATAFSLTALAQVPSNVPVAGLVAWYPLNNTATDLGPNGLNGTVNGTTAAENRFGDTGEASAFNGFSYDQVPASTLFNTGTGMTVSAWINLNDASANQKVMGRVNGSFNSGYILGVESGQLHPEVWNSVNAPHTFSAGNITSGAWTHIAITWATNGYLIGYVNGAAVDSIAAGASPIGTNMEPLIIGGSPWSTSPLFFALSGSIDDIGIWDRALAPSEIMGLFSDPTTGIYQPSVNTVSSVFPVPAISSVSIKATPELIGQGYAVIDATGRTVLQGTLDQAVTEVGVEGLAPGIYSIALGNGFQQLLRLVKK